MTRLQMETTSRYVLLQSNLFGNQEALKPFLLRMGGMSPELTNFDNQILRPVIFTEYLVET